MNMRTAAMGLLLLLGVSEATHAQRAPQCESKIDWSDQVERMFEVFTIADALEIRQSRGIITQSPSAPRGVLHDNATCVHLGKAVAQLTGDKTTQTLEKYYELSFFRFGEYVAVQLLPKRSPTDQVVSGAARLYVFHDKTLKFVTQLHF